MNLEQILDLLNSQLLDRENRCLNSTELIVLQGIWQNQTYNEIAQQEGYSSGYFANVVAPELWRRLSSLTGKRVTKKNCRAVLQCYISTLTPSGRTLPIEQLGNTCPNLQSSSSQSSSPRYPCGAVPLDSPFYLKQPSLEKQILEEIVKPGALVRIKAPQEMGKTSLLLRILDTCEQELGYKTVSVNLQKADRVIFGDLNQFLRWLCVNCARKLGLKPQLDEYWDEDLGSKMSWTIYFEEYLLDKIDSPFVIAFDEVNELFEQPVAEDFFPLLRSCYEEAKRLPIWQKLRLIVVHSTEIYVSLQLEQSPFNIGLPIELKGFSQQQVQQLAEKYGLNWKNGQESQQLRELVGGHPALIHLAIYYLYQGEITLEELLKTATTATGIYSHHLQRHWGTLQEQPELASALKNVYRATESVFLEPIIAYKLNSMGLIHLDGNKAIVCSKLYKEYFNKQWSQTS